MAIRWSGTTGLEDPRSNGNVIAQVVLEQLGVPAGGRAAAVGVVAVGRAHRRRRCPGQCFQCPGGDRPGQIVAAEASGQLTGGTGGSVAGRTPAAAWPAGRRPSDRPGGRPRA